jgi:hypothetical protein
VAMQSADAIDVLVQVSNNGKGKVKLSLLLTN